MGEDMCQLCRSSEDNELAYGKLHKYEDLVVHHFCLLFAPALMQNGDDDEGIEGFMPQDIKKEIRRVQPLKCCFCRKYGANLGCWNEKHHHGAYHMDCAWTHGVAFEFTSSFKTFCKQHARAVPKFPTDSECQICFEKMKKGTRFVLMPCCKQKYFHRDCLQSYAMNAGVFFKCPLCGDKDNMDTLKTLGIFFPNRDALWELEPDAFSEFVQPLKLYCESHSCLDKARQRDEQWMWKLCSFCGANGVHLKCFNGNAATDSFTCKGCEKVLGRIQQTDKYKRQRTWISDEEVLSDDEDEDPPQPPKKLPK